MRESVNVATATFYELADSKKDIQPYVVSTGKAMIVEDAIAEPLTNKDVISRAGIKNFAIVPITDRNEQVIGTIHIERSDGRAPAPDEVDDLQLFARQLSTAIQHGERLKLMQSTMDQLPDPILICDAQGKSRYANDSASVLLDVSPKWHKPENLPEASEVRVALIEALNRGSYFRPVQNLAGKAYDGDLLSLA